MSMKMAGVVGAIGALASLSPAAAGTADPADVLRASSYADLLQPIPNASEKLEALDRAQAGNDRGEVQLAQFFIEREHHHHHHHHHNSYYRRYGYGPRVVVVPRGFRHHHHHHHHHNSYYRRYRDDY